MSHPTKRDLQSREKRDAILYKSVELFSTQGYENTTMKDISNATGMSIGSIYHFFDSKYAILHSFGLSLSQQFRPMLEKTEENLKRPQEQLLRYFLANGAMFERIGHDLMFQLHIHTPSIWFSGDGKNAETASMALLQEYIAAAKGIGTLYTSLPAEEVTSNLYIGTVGVVHTWLLQKGRTSLIQMMNSFFPVLFRAMFEAPDGD